MSNSKNFNAFRENINVKRHIAGPSHAGQLHPVGQTQNVFEGSPHISEEEQRVCLTRII
jgi:hypothetical protein